MARTLTTPTSPIGPPLKPMRRGRYDVWLDGAIWELSPKDFKGRFKVRKASKVIDRARRSIAARARNRKLSVGFKRLAGPMLVVQAQEVAHG